MQVNLIAPTVILWASDSILYKLALMHQLQQGTVMTLVSLKFAVHCPFSLLPSFQQGIVKNYDQLLATRALLGVTEAGFFPVRHVL